MFKPFLSKFPYTEIKIMAIKGILTTLCTMVLVNPYESEE